MPGSQPRPRFRWHTLVIVALTIALLWWFFRGEDFGAISRAIGRANFRLIGLAVLVTFQTYVIRAWRWQALLRPIGAARFRTAFRTTVIGFTATFLLPGRIGEVLRPYLLARRDGFNAAAAFATVIVERVLDLACVLLLFGLFLLTSSLDVGREVKTGGVAASAAAILALVIMAVSAGHPERLAGWTGRATRLLPRRAADAASRFVHTFVEGLAVMRRPGPFVAAFGLTICLWLSIALGIWLASRALDVTFAFSGSFLLMMFLVLGVAVPTPAGVGGFHEAYRFAVVRFFAAPQDSAVAGAIVLHAVSFVPISLLGLAFMAQDGLTLTGLQTMKSTAQAAERE